MNDAAELISDMVVTEAPPLYMHIRRSLGRELHIVQRQQRKGKPIKPKRKKAYNEIYMVKFLLELSPTSAVQHWKHHVKKSLVLS